MFSVKKNVLQTVALVKAYGIDQIVLCPGSRNAPLIQTFSSDPFFKCHIIVDERNAAFYALGIIQNINKPVVVCCTSGSALLNFAPAVSEAYYQKLPLIVISGDRSSEWIGQMDGQTIPQLEAFGSLSMKTVQLPEVKNDTDTWFCNRLINECLITCQSLKAPVHINIPISEPLFDYTVKELPKERTIIVPKTTKTIEIKPYLDDLQTSFKTIIVVGQNIFNTELKGILERLVKKINCIVIVEHLSNCESDLFISNADSLLSAINDSTKQMLIPDILISVEGHIVSKRLKHFFRQNKPHRHWHISENLEVIDLFQSLTDIIEANPNHFFEGLIRHSDSSNNLEFYDKWKSISNKLAEPDEKAFSDIFVTAKFIQNLPQNSNLHLANSSVIRNTQYFKLPTNTKVFCNRGTNGIESSLPSAIGFAATSLNTTYLAIGDLSFFYTVGSLWNIKDIKNLRILLINNAGGGIFHLLPGLRDAPSLKHYVAAEHETSAKEWVNAAGFKYLSAKNETELENAFDYFFSTIDTQSIVLEVFTNIEITKQSINEYNNKLKNNI